ncbi:aminotransferase class I/II-fold pyridoxal phosphate-dependent enzyme [Clostridium sp. TF11-13AC]|uniref:pyridoxal phosphate-dependent aminotransferase n=1 Tax=Clostridium sp. TF11-13AC TaxID=2293053 RepID=UPI000E4FA18C|nr:aminotransferase class I/II-fold pyridoxal phosphate-dependent enzyme [Clostridium sp. TF11-13AC]RHU46585.1 aminotransferase class I/II-fold pyridoxal phosphate-dependent enzyme [Clostridium sp. TF11-13AC]
MPYTHGGDIYGDAAVELDFSVNTNRLGMPQAVRDAVMASAAAWEQYPDALCRKLRRAAAAFYETDGTPIPEDWLVFGNGASDILYAVVSAIRPKQAILLAPGFSEYEQALRMCGCEIRWLHLKEENGFSLESAREELYAMLFDGSGYASKIDSVPTLSSKRENVWEKILILGNPNNPTGRAISATELERLAEVCRETHTWLMLDECFQWFLDTRREGSFVGNLLNGVGDHVILLNALTKICSMAGLRLGYGIIPNAGLRECLEKFRQPWSVSAPAQAGGVAAFAELADHSEGNLLEWTVKFLQAERPRLAEKLEELGFIVYPSQTNYLLFRSPDEDSRDYKQGCLEHGILIRACENFEGLNRHYYRVAVRNRGENERLINILKEVQSEEKHNVNL